ncbi:MAG: hypothetical protein ABIH34_02375 [Nanoarchaeota archaeon]
MTITQIQNDLFKAWETYESQREAEWKSTGIKSWDDTEQNSRIELAITLGVIVEKLDKLSDFSRYGPDTHDIYLDCLKKYEQLADHVDVELAQLGLPRIEDELFAYFNRHILRDITS